MKTLVKLFVIAMLAVIPATTVAQNKKQPDPEKREAFAKAQATEIAKKLELNEDLTKKFTDTYLEYQKQMWTVGRIGFNNRPKFEDMTEEQAKEENKARLDHQRKVLDIRSEYYEKYSKFLTQKQILRANELEKRMFARMMQKNRRNGDDKGTKQGQRPDRKQKRSQK